MGTANARTFLACSLGAAEVLAAAVQAVPFSVSRVVCIKMPSRSSYPYYSLCVLLFKLLIPPVSLFI